MMTIKLAFTADELKCMRAAVSWWTAAEDNDTGIMPVGPVDRAHIALARDTADQQALELGGARGINTTAVVLIDEHSAIIAQLQDDECPDIEAADLVVAAADLPMPDGMLDLARDILPIEGAVWDGQNHVVFEAKRARAYVTDERHTKEDGNVTWVYDNDGDGENLSDVQIAEGWKQMDFYATNGYGNESSMYGLEDTDSRTAYAAILDALDIKWEYSIISDGASNAPAEAAIFIVDSADFTLAESIAIRLLGTATGWRRVWPPRIEADAVV